MGNYTVVIDTCVFIAALRSRRGASFRVLSLVGTGKFDIAISVPLVFKYESAARRILEEISPDEEDVEAILDYLCLVGKRQEVFYLWRPFLRDPKDDMILELAVAVGGATIVTFNVRDFQGAERFGVRVMTPQAFLREIGEIP